MSRSGNPLEDGIYATRLEPVIAKIDEFIPGFYPLFDYRFSMRYRIANLILGDDLRLFFVTVSELCYSTETYADELTKRRLSLWVGKTRRRMANIRGFAFKDEQK